MIVGITGGIGSGKSTVAKIFATLGVPIYDADAATKKLYNTNLQLKATLQHHFGEAAYQNNQLDKKYLANIVFNNKEKLELLNSIVHPLSIADSVAWAKQQQAAYVIKEAALLFESESFHYVDYVIGVTAPQALRIQRVMEREGNTREEVLARINKQIPDTIKMRLCNSVITNDEQTLIIPQVVHLHQQLLALTK